MARQLTNDTLAAKAMERALKARPDSRDRRAWQQCAAALSVTGTQESARAFLWSLTIPTLKDDAVKALNRLIAGELEALEKEEGE